jgi:hypothetical protein
VPSTVDLLVRVGGDVAGLNSALGEGGKSVSAFGKSVDLGGVAKLAGMATVAGGVALAIADMTQAAAADQAEQARLTAAIQAAGAATGDYAAQVDAAIVAGQDRAFSDTQTREALMSLVTATGDVTTATTELSAAQDIARFANVDLATAADAVAKAHAGQDGALRKLLPGLEKGATTADTLANATKLAAGQADAFANSAAGMQARGADAFGELTETIGAAFLPVLEALLPAVIPLIRAFGTLVSAVLPLLTPILRLIGAALGVVVSIITKLVGIITTLIGWLSKAISTLGRFLDAINPLKGISLPSLPFLSSAVAPSVGLSAGAFADTRAAGGTVSSRAGLVINVYTTGDSIEAERAVVRALTRAQRMNAGLVVPALSRS